MGENGWLSPAVATGYATVCYQVNVPDNDEYRRAFFGALNELSIAYNWDTDGDQDKADEIATYWRHLLFYEVSQGCGDTEADEDEAPYWDDIESVAGAGEGEKWGYEDIADWAITAFLAVAGSPGAALFYRTSVSRARLAFQTHDLGGLAHVFIDGILAFAIDTASGVPGVSEVIEADIDLVDFKAIHDLVGDERVIRIVKAA